MTGECAAVTFRAGDRVLIAVSHDIEHAHASKTLDRLRERFPGVEFTVAANVTAVAVYRDEDES